jgi:plastocyanin
MKKLSLFAVTASASLAVALTQPTTPVLGAATGKVLLDGAKPEVKPLAIDAAKFPDCGTIDATNETALVDDKGGIAGVVVIVEVAGAEVKPLEKVFQLDQKNCRFEPHVAIVPAGTTVEYLNNDKTSHNVHTFPTKNDAINKTVPAGGKEAQKLDKEDRIEIKCDIHPWMQSYLVVASSNFFAVTGKDGSFSIEGLPAGEHKVKLWHETFGKGDGKIVVDADGKAAPVEFKLSAEKKAGRGRK